MTIEITSNPHSFIVFLTICMGLGYAFFHNPGFGLGKLLVLVFIGGSLFLTAYERHHIVDVSLGLLIGFLHAKGKIGVLNPASWFSGFFYNLKWQSQSRKQERENAQAEAEFQRKRSEYQEQEARQRQEQAQRDREQARQNQQKQSSSNSSRGSSTNKNNRYQQSNNNQYHKPQAKPPSERDKALQY